MANLSNSSVDVFCSQFDGGCTTCVGHLSCVFCQSTNKCLHFSLPRIGMVPWSICPPNLSSVYWSTCSMNYAYLLALEIALIVFICLCTTLGIIFFIRWIRTSSKIALCHRQQNLIDGNQSTTFWPSFKRNNLDDIGNPESDRLLESPAPTSYGKTILVIWLLKSSVKKHEIPIMQKPSRASLQSNHIKLIPKFESSTVSSPFVFFQ